MKNYKDYIKLIRVKHWLKNILVFLPLFFSLGLLDKNKLILNIIAFFVFSFSSSIVYIINDIKDIESDRKHEIKKNRPLASGRIKIINAIYVIIFLSIILILSIIFIYLRSHNILSILIPIIYILLNILYSYYLKHYPIIDVAILVSGFLLRVVYGGVVINVAVSIWMYLMVMFGSFYMGFGKRRNEIIKNGKDSRKVLQYYSKEFLDKNMYVNLTLAIFSYSLWCVDKVTIEGTTSNYLYLTIPLVIIIFQLYSLNIERDSHGDPIEIILSNKALLSLILLYGFLMSLIIYI